MICMSTLGVCAQPVAFDFARALTEEDVYNVPCDGGHDTDPPLQLAR
jgi:hypothetical protein